MGQFITWWYGDGWRRIATGLRRQLRRTYLGFSIPILLRTLFAPWRRIISVGDESIIEQFRSFLDNLVSRGVGLTVRTLALIAAGVLLLGTVITGLLILIVWPLLPIISLALIGWGIIK